MRDTVHGCGATNEHRRRFLQDAGASGVAATAGRLGDIAGFDGGSDDDIDRSASAGEWANTVLEVPAGEAEFAVTLTTEVVGE